ncbi:MAG: hypothetical protein LBI99_03695 [Propionibacteriaceae bacterium]|nr:hypothetical protein [Propionibacteriaceae bacterium]
MKAIPAQVIDIYPGLVKSTSTTIPIEVTPADAFISVTTTSTDKATIAVSSDNDAIVVTPIKAGTVYAQVTAAKDGYETATQIFPVKIVAQIETDEYNWHGDAKIGGSGYVTMSVYSQIEKNVLYAQTDIGGAYRYDYANEYWIGLNDDASDHSSTVFDASGNFITDLAAGNGRGTTFVTAIAPDPVKKGRVYMVAGNNANNSSLLRSDDYGDHWKRFRLGVAVNGNDGSNRSTGNRLAIDPNDNSVLYYAARSNGLWKSTDFGEHWTRIVSVTTPQANNPVGYDPTFVTIDPNTPTNAAGESTHLVVGTTGDTDNTWAGTAPNRTRPYAALWETTDAGATWSEVPGQPAPGVRDQSGFVAEHVDWDANGDLVAAYAEFGMGVNSYNLEDPTNHAAYTYGSAGAPSAIGSNSNFAHDGRLYRFTFGTKADGDPVTGVNITPPNVNTREYPPLTELQAENPQQWFQRGGLGGVSVDRQTGAIVASTFHRHDRMAEEVVYYSPDGGTTWRVAHSEVVGKKDFRGYGYIDKDNGWGAAAHWAFDIKLNPFNSDEALFTTGAGFWVTRNLTAAVEPITADNQVVWGFWDDGFEETVMWNLYSPSQTKDYLYATYADWGSMSWAKDYTISPTNSLVNRESYSARQMYDTPEFDEFGDPTYRPDLAPDPTSAAQQFDVAGSRVSPSGTALGTGWYLKYKSAEKPLHGAPLGDAADPQPYLERWMNTQNMDYAGNNQKVFVFTPAGQYQNSNCSAGVISFDEGKTGTPLAVPAGITGSGGQGFACANANSGWISVTADGNTVVWSVGGQSIANTYWADVSAGPLSPVVGSHQGRQIGESEVRRIERRNPDGTPDYGDRTAWTKVNFFQQDGTTPATGNAKIFSDKVNANILYGIVSGKLYVSTDGGKNFIEKAVVGATVPAVNWNTSSHSQGGNKVQVDPFHTNAIYLAPNNAAAGLVKLTSPDNGVTWSGAKVSPGTTSLFQQVGIGIGIGTNTVPALYAVGTIADNSQWSPAPAHWGVYRSLDDGATWKRINDDEHQYGDLRALSGDSRVFGRVYLGTGTRGTRVADVNWDSQEGPVDEGYVLNIAASAPIIGVGEELNLTAALTDIWGGSSKDVTAGATFSYSVSDIEIDSLTTFHPTVSYTYVVRGSYTFTDSTGTHTLTSAPVSVEVVNVDALLPVISGTNAVGSTLTASVPAGWAASYTWLRDGQPIGHTGPSYVVADADAGKSLSVSAVVTKLGVSYTRSAKSLLINHTLKFTAKPTPKISGTAKVGKTLTAKPGSWKPSGATFSYTWYRSGVEIIGANANTYTLVGDDKGKKITVKATAAKTGYEPATSKASKASKKVAAGTLTKATPVIAGTVKVGETVTAVAGAWGPGSVTLKYQWYRSGKSISGATTDSYTLASADYKKKLTVKVTGSQAGYSTTSKTSKSKTVAAGTLSTAPTPVISGTAAVGQTLTADPGACGPGTVTLKYQWYRSGKSISKATKATLTLAAADENKLITVKVTCSRSGYTSVSQTSAPTSAVATGTLVSAVPTITGTPAVGQTLTAKPGTWTSGTVFIYQWIQDSGSGPNAIPGATKSTYKLANADAGAQVSVRITGSKAGYVPTTLDSAQVFVI